MSLLSSNYSLRSVHENKLAVVAVAAIQRRGMLEEYLDLRKRN
jgi:hypothetical protein